MPLRARKKKMGVWRKIGTQLPSGSDKFGKSFC